MYLGEYIIPPNSPFSRADLECPVCHCILCQPVKLGCDNVVCSRCCKQWVQDSSPSCPCGSTDHPFTPDAIQTPSKVLLNILGNLLITCRKCGNTLKASDHSSHLSGKCKTNLCQLPATPPSAAPSEEKIASRVMRRKLSESEDGATISLSTSGKVTVGRLKYNYSRQLSHSQSNSSTYPSAVYPLLRLVQEQLRGGTRG